MDLMVRAEVIAFLREWIPDSVKAVYRTLIAEDPESWRAHPHFAAGIMVEHALRGNGLTEEALGVPDLEKIWPELLELALRDEKLPIMEPPPSPLPG